MEALKQFKIIKKFPTASQRIVVEHETLVYENREVLLNEQIIIEQWR